MILFVIFVTTIYALSVRESIDSSAVLSWKLRGSTTSAKTLKEWANLLLLPNRKLHPSELETLNYELSKIDLEGILQWSHDAFQERLVDVTSFGISGMVILYKLQEMDLLKDMPVITIDTLHLFPETYEFINSFESVSSMELSIFFKCKPINYTDKVEFDEMYGTDLWKTKPDRYNYLSKVEPTMRSLDELNAKAWITGRRRDQGGERSTLPILEIDSFDKSRYKINPLANWSYDVIWKFVKDNDIPYNPLYDRGFKSIGDYMTTAPVDDGAAERSGRFVGLGHTTECGIHSTREKVKKMKEEAKISGRDFDGFMSLPCPECTYAEITPDTFDDIVFNVKTENMLLIELYSPMCGGCVEFAPKFHKIIHAINDQLGDKLETGRYDVTENDVPQSGHDFGIKITSTPDLYILKRNKNDDSKLIHYSGEYESEAVIQWVSKEVGVSIFL